MIKRFQVTDPPMFWLVSRVVRPSPSPWMPSPPRYLTSAISASWSSVSNSCGHHTSLVAAFPLEPLSISSDEALAPARRFSAHKTEGGWGGGTDDHFMKPRDDVTGGDARQRNRDVHAPLPLPSPFHSPSTHIWFLSFFLFERRNGRDGRNLLGWRDILVLRSRRYNVCVCVTTKICPLSGRKKIRDKGRCKLTNLCW